MPTGPSIAVLPLTNLTGDRAQEYFVDGVTKDIGTEISPLSVVSAAIQARTSRIRISRYPKSRYGAS
jgi:TolB-like protein